MTDIESLEREIAEPKQANTAALHDAVARFCNYAALLEHAFANAVDSSDREWAVLEVIKSMTSLQAALRPRQTHLRTYRFGNAEETVVVCSDGASFRWELDAGENSKRGHVNPANISYSRTVERWHEDGNPWPESYKGDK